MFLLMEFMKQRFDPIVNANASRRWLHSGLWKGCRKQIHIFYGSLFNTVMQCHARAESNVYRLPNLRRVTLQKQPALPYELHFWAALSVICHWTDIHIVDHTRKSSFCFEMVALLCEMQSPQVSFQQDTFNFTYESDLSFEAAYVSDTLGQCTAVEWRL